MTAEGALTLDRGLALLQAVADAGGDAATISELAATIGASRAAVYRLLVPLSARGLVRRDGNKVRLSVGVLRLAGQVLPQLREAARPVLRALAEKAEATAHLSLAEGDHVEAVVVVEPSSTDVHVAYRVGTRQPIGAGAAGKALSLKQEGRGWVTSSGDVARGVVSLAAPVRGVPALKASVGVLSLGPVRAEVTGPQVVAAAIALTGALK
ncbi:helix-turn-helix domain-containing protein [Amycolatopsis cynarae]|uniref:Helix-turn-helix domain-containing protein n=1 Tax=Amycolatopsis cynarae TaxID=2995223 RepID=A0ABY7AZL5_9PSEU|nr:helix-turn-helix domain-containing protein [Amycolatopsis sp. HUAS 11-8]WAL65471.1 helix-turn-helix domain-containing protein [Amycolatopsis sp. HUAS 11-8]